ncbi:MAG: hypothetical protein FWF80_05905 [Defluviitaleaceae bacterium]|nr:hypothetical protein [Defluviitaleaceae bacterium]
MPLNFPPAPTAYFSRGREGQHSTAQGEGMHSGASSPASDVFLRNYPLGITREPRRAMPVDPISMGMHAQKSPMIPMQNHAQKPPMIPQQNHMHRSPPIPQQNHMHQSPQGQMPPQQMPRQQATPQHMQDASPAVAAEQFRRANKNLPDGVRYEPLDEETMKILRGAAAQRGQASTSETAHTSEDQSNATNT